MNAFDYPQGMWNWVLSQAMAPFTYQHRISLKRYRLIDINMLFGLCATKILNDFTQFSLIY